ncbi:MAG: electron transfer flavoprotein subunit alpha/FixB family protein [Acholeplasmataceae bacterium]
MGYIKINQKRVNDETARELIDLCPFDAFDYTDSYLRINAACKQCKLCVKKGPKGVCEWVEDEGPKIDRSLYKGIVVLCEHHRGRLHPVTRELLGKARELAAISKEKVIALLIGHDTEAIESELERCGADEMHVFADAGYEPFNVEIHARVIESFFEQEKVNVILFGGTPRGRSLAPRVAAKLRTGLTADCTKLEITKEGELLQIRPAFGGNIMAKIHTPNHRPQLASIRYKIFDEPARTVSLSQRIAHRASIDFTSSIRSLEIRDHPPVKDIADADIIIALGRAFKSKKDLALVEPLRKKLNAELACTRPLIENGWFDPRKQIGLSGRTVKPKLIINLGISGAIQYIEGMKDAELIISVNSDPDNRLFSISDYAIIGDIYEVLPELIRRIDSLEEVSP